MLLAACSTVQARQHTYAWVRPRLWLAWATEAQQKLLAPSCWELPLLKERCVPSATPDCANGTSSVD